MPNTRYNANSLFNPFQGLLSAPANGIVHVDHLSAVGATASVDSAYVGQQNTSSGTATFAVETATESDHYGVCALTSDGTGTARISNQAGTVLLSASVPWHMEALVKFVTGGSYFIGFHEYTASGTNAITTTTFAANTQGCGWMIQTDDKGDLISRGTSSDTLNTAVTDVYTFTAGTWYRIGIRAKQGLLEGFVNGRKVGQQTMSTTITTAMTPSCCQSTATAAKILRVDWIGVAY